VGKLLSFTYLIEPNRTAVFGFKKPKPNRVSENLNRHSTTNV